MNKEGKQERTEKRERGRWQKMGRLTPQSWKLTARLNGLEEFKN